ncbi:site-specific integrase [Bacteroides sp. 224]|uniref:site-specific integrase n=1 Tax=Bacteroides sp. 224 TaxID=2302936 RepID=UPI0013D27C68|nr:site-specific integrase [Bacteroides sp. 224]NDV64702.1 site-specific integrase [Bacteroides sp. 224]
METNNRINNPINGREKRRSTFAVLFYINRTKIRKDGMCQLLCKISIDAESEQVGTKVSVNPSLWNPETGLANGKSRNALEVNRAIERLTEKINTHYTEIRKSLGFVTAELVKNALKGHAQKAHTLMKLFEEHNNEFENRIGVDRVKETHMCYLRTYALLLEFLQKKYEVDDINLKSLNLTFMDEFDFFLRKDYQMAQATISGHLITLKKMTRRAVSQGTLRRDPFINYHPEQPAKKSHHQKVEDLQRLMQCKIENTALQRIRDWFIFSTFTGLAYADLKRLAVEHLKQAEDGSWWIHIERRKTKTECHVRLLEIPLQIIEKYKHERKSNLIFNLYSRGYTCRLIHQLEEICKIDRITFHQSRHNFGTHITLSQGVPIETVSRMMGHTSITTTQIYAKVTDTKVEEDMKRLKARTSDRKIMLHEDEELRAAIRFPRKNKKRKTNQTTNQNS